MTDIIRQKFLAELGKLLTFMYEEDRQTALAMYGKMFDDAEDERDLVQFLGSPTRQAVVIARTYNARMRKLQVESQSREQDGAEAEAAPDFVLAIDELYQQYFPVGELVPEVMDNQVSLFEDAPLPAEEIPAPAPVRAVPEPAVPAVPEEAAVAETVEALQDEAELGAADASTADAVEQVFDEAAAQSELKADAVDEFIDQLRIEEEPAGGENAPTARVPYVPEVAEEPVDEFSEEPLTVRRPRVFLLILYILFAVPITLAAVVLLLIPTLLFLALAAACVAAGVAVLAAAFSGFKILADFLLLFGGAVVLLALGLLSLWLFVWFIAGAIAGMITGVIHLAGNWCYKEVSA